MDESNTREQINLSRNEKGIGGVPILEVVNLQKNFGGIKALDMVSLQLKQGDVLSVIGPNGAGKSTFINVTTGMYNSDGGRILLSGREITTLPAHRIAHLGISRTFQLEELFGHMTVLENVMVGCHVGSKGGLLSIGFRFPSTKSEERRIKNQSIESLHRVGLESKAHEPISALPLGQRKLLGIARALAMQPKILMLDEPAGGLAAHEIAVLSLLIRSLVEEGMSLIIIEHNMPFVMSISERVAVFEYGRKIAEGSPEEIQSDPKVIKAYLGEED